jgi:ABC-type branched-subunit amino acid transport system substrate-binding protein
VRDYRQAFRMQPATWGSFTYDSARMLFAAMRRAGTTAYRPVMRELRATRGFRGATGTITINPRTGDREQVAVKILSVSPAGQFTIVP